MPISNKRGPFKNNSAKLLAQKHELSPEEIIPKKNLITIYDIQYIVDNIYYCFNGTALYDKKNVPLEKRYDTDWAPYTRLQFYEYYGKDYGIHWEKGIIYKPMEDISELIETFD